MKIEVANVGELKNVSQQILSFAGDERIFMFYGEMGAGKTTLINSLCVVLGTKDKTSSPTFSIVNEYSLEEGGIFHFDFYRLKTQTEALDFGYEDYFYSGNYCFIEWPEKIIDLWPDSFIKIKIEVLEDDKRTVELERMV